jgi:hypothetical protein
MYYIQSKNSTSTNIQKCSPCMKKEFIPLPLKCSIASLKASNKTKKSNNTNQFKTSLKCYLPKVNEQ